MGTPVIRPAEAKDAAAIAGIYNHYVAETIVTFDEKAVTADDIERRIREAREAPYPWFVAELSGEVRGYAHAGAWKGRCAFRHSVESTIYLAHGEEGRGIGSALYERLLASLEAQGVHAVVGGISLPNDASVAFHEKHGFEKVAHFPEIGFKFGRWIDVGYWQRTFR